LGKNLYGHGHPREAADELERAIALPLSAPRVRREALRMRLLDACALGDRTAAERALGLLRADSELSPARRHGVEHVARRCGLH
jgi:hypothetical protein